MILREVKHSILLFQHISYVETLAKMLYAHHNESKSYSTHHDITWETIVTLTHQHEPYIHAKKSRYDHHLENKIAWNFRQTNSLVSRLHQARQQARILQTILGKELWQIINRTYQWLQLNKTRQMSQRTPQIFYRMIMQQCQLIHGVLQQNFVHDEVYHCFRLGSYVEKFWQTTLVLQANSHRKKIEHQCYFNLLNAFGATEFFVRNNNHSLTQDTIYQFFALHPHYSGSLIYCSLKIIDCLEALRDIAPSSQNNALTQANNLLNDLEKISNTNNFYSEIKQLLPQLEVKIRQLMTTLLQYPEQLRTHNNKQMPKEYQHESTK